MRFAYCAASKLIRSKSVWEKPSINGAMRFAYPCSQLADLVRRTIFEDQSEQASLTALPEGVVAIFFFGQHYDVG
jgi:hypothetical protein